MSYRRKRDPVTDIKAENGIPLQFKWDNKAHVVDDIAKRRRIDDRGGEQRVWQDRFKITTTTGVMVILVHDLLTDAWFVLREFD